MARIRNEPRMARRMAAFFGLVAGLALGGFAIASAASGTSAPEQYVVVRHVLYAGPNGELISEEAGSTTVSAQFVVNQHIWALNSLPVPVQYNADGAPGGLSVTNIITQAIGTWNGAGSGFSFAWGGSSSGDTGSCAPGNPQIDGINTIRFENLTGLTLGQTCTIYPAGSSSKLIEFDMQLDNDGAWSADLPVPGNKYDLPTTILHELGHAAGLGHNCGPSSGITCTDSHKPALMYFQVSAGQDKRALTQDDLDGIRAAYPPVPTNTPTLTPTSTPTVAPTTPLPTVPASFKVRTLQLARD